MLHEQLTQLFIGAALMNEAMAAQNAESIGINDERGFSKGVEENAVGGLRPDSLDAKESRPQARQVGGGQLPMECSKWLPRKSRKFFRRLALRL